MSLTSGQGPSGRTSASTLIESYLKMYRPGRSPRCWRTRKKYQNRAIEAGQVIEELISLSKDMREAHKRREQLGLT